MTRIKLIKTKTEEELAVRLNEFNISRDSIATQIFQKDNYWVAFVYFREDKI